MKRCENIVFEAEKGRIFENPAEINSYYENYKNPPILEGYEHICGEWNNGFVIERYSDGSQFGWIPVGSLQSNGTLDGVSFTEKFGRRNYRNDEFSEREFHEMLTNQLKLQIASVMKYGGFYISCYNISVNKRTGKLQSVRGEMPITNIKCADVKMLATTIEDNETVKSHLTFGAEYDSVQEWFIESNARTFSEISEDSSNWGNYWNTRGGPKKVVETGSCEEWCTHHIYDFAGNIDEWTQEQNGRYYVVIRGGDARYLGYRFPVAYRSYSDPASFFKNTGFRVALYIR